MSAADDNTPRQPKNVDKYVVGHWFGFIYTASVAIFSACSWCSAGEYFHALLCVGGQFGAILGTLYCRQAIINGQWAGAVLNLILSGGGSAWAGLGLQNSWEKGGSDPLPTVMYFGMAAFEPLLFLLIEHVKEGRKFNWGDTKAAVAGAVLTINNKAKILPKSQQAPPHALIKEKAPPKASRQTHELADKRAKAIGLMREHPDWSDQRIANIVDGARSTINRWRNESIKACEL